MTSIRALAPARRAGRVPSPRPPRASSSCSSEAPNRETSPPSSSSSSSSSDGIREREPVAGRRVVSLAALAAAAAAALGSPRLVLANVVGDDAGEPTGLDPAGGSRPRLRKCPATFNCVSTSSTGGAPEQFATAWTAPVKNLDEAIAQITAATLRACPDARKLDAFETGDGSRYVRFATLGKLGVDNVEFLVKNEGIGDRMWDGDDDQKRDYLVTYRSFATTVKYVYPFMTPVSDLGEQRKRMERIRAEVEWPRVGCEIEGFCDNDL